MFHKDEYTKLVRFRLNQHTNDLVKTLNKIARYKFCPKVKIIDFEIFIEPSRFVFDLMMYSMDREHNEVFSDEKCFADSVEIVENLNYYDAALFTDELWDDDELLIELEKIDEASIFEWFISCWKNSKFRKCRIPSYIAIHDTVMSYDLKQDKWIHINEKYL